MENLNVVDYCWERVLSLSKADSLLNEVEGNLANLSRTEIKENGRKRTTSFLRHHMPRRKKRIKGTQSNTLISESQVGAVSCRKSRRRPHILLKHIHNVHIVDNKLKWLETHIWHRKRMRMENKWGYAIPQHHLSRGLRFLRKAIKNSIICDMSHNRPLEVSGLASEVLGLLSKFIDPMSSLLSSLRDFIEGTSNHFVFREMEELVFSCNQFPSHCLGPITWMMIPISPSLASGPSGGGDELAKVLIWAHPAIYPTLLGQLKESTQTPAFPSSGGCEVGVVTEGLLRFSLRGRSVHEVIAQALPVLAMDEHTNQECSATTLGDEESETQVKGVMRKAGRASLLRTSNAQFFSQVIRALTAAPSVERSSFLDSKWSEGMALSLNIRDVRCLRIFGGAGVDTVALTDSAVGAQQQDGPSHASASDQSPGPRQHRCQPRRGAPKLNGDEEKVSGEQGEKEMLWESQSGDGLSTLGTGGHRLDEGKAVMRNGSRSRKRNRNRIRWPGIAETSLSSLWSDAGRAAAAAAFRPDHIWNAQRHEQCKHLHRARLYDLSKSTIEQAAAAHAERDRVLNRLPKALPNAVPNAARQSASSINEGISEPIVPIVLIRKSAGEGEGDGPRRRRWGGRSDPYSGIDSLEGFDIILPANWGPSVWKALHFAGARAVGAQEFDRLQLNSGKASFPRDYPDTEAGAEYWTARLTEELRQDRARTRQRRRRGVDVHRDRKAAHGGGARDGRFGSTVPDWDLIGMKFPPSTITKCPRKESRKGKSKKNEKDTSGGENKDNFHETIVFDIGGKDDDAVCMHSTARETKHDKAFGAQGDVVNNRQDGDDDGDPGSGGGGVVDDEEGSGVVFVGDRGANSGDEMRNFCGGFLVVRDERYFSPFRPCVRCPAQIRGPDEVSAVKIQKGSHRPPRRVARVKILNTFPDLPPTPKLMVTMLIRSTGRGVPKDGACIVSATALDCKEWLYYRSHRSETTSASPFAANRRLGDWRGIDWEAEVDLEKKRANDSRSASLDLALNSQTGPNESSQVNAHNGDFFDESPSCTSQAKNQHIQSRDDSAGAIGDEDLRSKSDRRLIGFVTSGQSGGNGKSVALAICDVRAIFDAHQLFHSVSERAHEQSVCAEDKPGSKTDAKVKKMLTAVGDCEGEGRGRYDVMDEGLDCGTREGPEVGAAVIAGTEHASWSSSRYALVMFHNPGSHMLRPALAEYYLQH